MLQATFNTLIASIMKREIQFKTTEKTVMAATVTDAANKAKSRAKNSWTAAAWTPVQVHADVRLMFGVVGLCAEQPGQREYVSACLLSAIDHMAWLHAAEAAFQVLIAVVCGCSMP